MTKKYLKKGLTGMLITGLVMGTCAPAFANTETLDITSNIPSTYSQQEDGNQNSSRIVVSYDWSGTIGFQNINPQTFEFPQTVSHTCTVDGITYTGVVTLVKGTGSISTTSAAATYKGVLYAVI